MSETTDSSHPLTVALQPVRQQDETGCGLACVAMLSGLSYQKIKQLARTLGIEVSDEALWSETGPIRQLLSALAIEYGDEKEPFAGWETLPDTALLATKLHQEKGRDHWHWCIHQRLKGESRVLDPAPYLHNNLRLDINNIHPAWFIRITQGKAVRAANSRVSLAE